jgi:hypothetical protein
LSVPQEALAYLGVAGSYRYDRPSPGAALTRQEQRELAATMRALPGRFADRLSESALERVQVAAAEARWEQAVEDLITALSVRIAPVTADEREQLHAGLAAMNMACEQLDALGASHRPCAASGGREATEGI